MTLCAYGPRVKASSPDWFVIAQADIAAKFGPIAGWLTAWAMGLPTGPVDTAAFCATEPDLELPVPDDYGLLAFPVLALAAGTYRRFGNQIKAELFNDYCECAPGGLGAETLIVNVSPTSPIGSGYRKFSEHAIPAGYQELRMEIVSNVPTSGDVFGTGHVNPSTGTNLLYTGSISTSFGSPTARPWIPSTYESVSASKIEFWSVTNVPNAGAQFTYHIKVYGKGPSTTPTTYPPPDPLDVPADYPPPPEFTCSTIEDICASLTELAQTLRIQGDLVQLIQRQAVPFAYMPGTAHAALSGSGSFAVQGILGLVVNITTLPSAYASVASNPPLLWDVGYVTLGTADGDQAAVRVQHDPLLIAPVSGMITSVKYHLKPGVVATITELVREA